MKLVFAVRRLRQRPLLVAAALVLACLVGVAIPYQLPSLKSRQHDVGIASAAALVDTTRSQVADLGDGAGSAVTPLAYRASLLASIMTSPSIKDDIAHLAGVSPSNLIVTGPATVVGSDSPAPSVSNASISASSPKADVITASIPTLAAGQLPVIQVNSQARTPALAANLANDAFQALESDVNSAAGTDKVPALQRVVIRPLGPASSAKSTQGPGLMLGVVGAVLCFILACAAILGLSSVGAAWRTESSVEHGVPVPEPDDPFLHDIPLRDDRLRIPLRDDRLREPITVIEAEVAIDDEALGVHSAAQELAKARDASSHLDLAYSRLSRLLEIDPPADAV